MSAVSYLAHCPLGPVGTHRNELQFGPDGARRWRMWWRTGDDWRPGPWRFKSWWEQ